MQQANVFVEVAMGVGDAEKLGRVAHRLLIH